MAQTVSISEQIFRRWCDKLRNEQILPKTLVDEIETLYEQHKLSNAENLGTLLKQMVRADDDKDK